MKQTTLVASIVALLMLAGLPVSAANPGHGGSEKGLLVIVAASFPLTNIKLAVLRRAFEGLASDIDGKRIIPINHPNEMSTRQAFDRAVLGLEPDAVGQFWIDRRIRDEGTPPRMIRSEELALRVVASLPGAITYLSPRLLNASVRALAIEGKTLGQSGYLLAE